MNIEKRIKRRFFNRRERITMYLAAGGACAECGEPLSWGWHADHRKPWSRGGTTDIRNGQALCAVCNLRKGDDEQEDQPPD